MPTPPILPKKPIKNNPLAPPRGGSLSNSVQNAIQRRLTKGR